jgi:hypothetical protein
MWSNTCRSAAVRPDAAKALRGSPGQPPGKSRRLSGSPPALGLLSIDDTWSAFRLRPAR